MDGTRMIVTSRNVDPPGPNRDLCRAGGLSRCSHDIGLSRRHRGDKPLFVHGRNLRILACPGHGLVLQQPSSAIPHLGGKRGCVAYRKSSDIWRDLNRHSNLLHHHKRGGARRPHGRGNLSRAVADGRREARSVHSCHGSV